MPPDPPRGDVAVPEPSSPPPGPPINPAPVPDPVGPGDADGAAEPGAGRGDFAGFGVAFGPVEPGFAVGFGVRVGFGVGLGVAVGLGVGVGVGFGVGVGVGTGAVITIGAGLVSATVLTPGPKPDVAVAANGHDPTGSVRAATYVMPLLNPPLVGVIGIVPTPGMTTATVDGSQPRVSR